MGESALYQTWPGFDTANPPTYQIWFITITIHGTIMGAAFGRLHNSGAGAFGARPTVVDSIVLDGEAASIAIPKTYTQSDIYPIKAAFFEFRTNGP